MKVNSKYLLFTILTLLAHVKFSAAQTINIDLNKNYQIIRGFGGMNHTTWIKDLNEDNREKAFGNDPGEMGLSILRIHLDPDPARFNLELPTSQHALQKGAIVLATPWNAPNSVLVQNVNPSRVDPAKYGQYVAHLNSFNTYMTSNGAPLYAISVQNEPDWGEWTRWTSAEMLDFMSNYAQDIENKVMAAESFQFRRAFTDPILNDVKAVANLDIIGGHIYGGGLFDYPLARQKEKEVWMTEHLLGSNANETNDWNLALTVGKEINDCMKANFNAYIWWYIRRFYGLITDDGNITDKGYVLSQYAKFIRPGAVRIDVDDSSVNLVNVTAYKTDTSLVMVVINQNTGSVNLNFNIENGNFEKLTQFTSTSTKKMVNDGEFVFSDGSFSATIDARSVTTFTTHPNHGGKKGNVAPVASAGEDIELTDDPGTGEISFTLNGFDSNDPDGEITNYSWSKNGAQIAWIPSPEVKLNPGIHSFVLTVTDNDGATNSDTVNIVVTSLNNTHVWLEAECVEVGSNWEIKTDINSSNQKYLIVKSGTQSLNNVSVNSADHLVYRFYLPESGNYKLWGRAMAPTPDDDSFWVRINDDNWVNWNGIPGGSNWQWDDIHNQSNDNPMVYALDSGYHTLTVCFREDGAGIDKFYLTNTGLVPSGFGNDATNCTPTTDNEADIKISNTIKVFPNPVKSNLRIESNEPFSKLIIYNIYGQKVMDKTCASAITSLDLPVDFKKGIYLLRLTYGKQSTVTKFLVEN